MSEQQDSDGLVEQPIRIGGIEYVRGSITESFIVRCRELEDANEAMSRQLVERTEALRKITDEQHEPDCKYQFCPLPECPTCPSAATIARKALEGSGQ